MKEYVTSNNSPILELLSPIYTVLSGVSAGGVVVLGTYLKSSMPILPDTYSWINAYIAEADEEQNCWLRGRAGLQRLLISSPAQRHAPGVLGAGIPTLQGSRGGSTYI
jgi:hypothetical protein